MKIVINISKYDREWIRNAYRIPAEINTIIAEAIINGEIEDELVRCKDLVEVVRCKDCKYFVTNYAVPHCGRTLIGMKKSDFCSFGERKEE